jgi:hypothetical protein
MAEGIITSLEAHKDYGDRYLYLVGDNLALPPGNRCWGRLKRESKVYANAIVAGILRKKAQLLKMYARVELLITT